MSYIPVEGHGLRRAGRIAVLALALAGALIACGDGERDVVEGVVTDVVGDLTTVEEFVIRTTSDEVLRFEPAPGMSFGGSTPITHINDHLRSGAPVRVSYEQLADGTLIAHVVTD